ncbi:MAG: RidA family protein, partial [Burkholderiaceae bacterium]|nr:RidA family protein [Burkholderiaceae bacterium]
MATVERINPPGLFELEGFSQVVLARGGRTAYIAGQGPFDAGMNLIGRGDLHAQTVQAFRNLRTALQALG